MKKFALAAAAVAALTTAAPVVAQEAPASPFVGTQSLPLGLGGLGAGGLGPLFVIGGIATIVTVAAASDTN